MRNKQNLSVVAGLLVIAIVGLIGFTAWYVHGHRSVTSPTSSDTNASVTFSGKITEINNACYTDGTCSVTVDDKSIVTGGGLSVTDSSNQYGNLGPSGGNFGFKIGQTVSVRALKTNYGYTLQGCADCYVK